MPKRKKHGTTQKRKDDPPDKVSKCHFPETPASAKKVTATLSKHPFKELSHHCKLEHNKEFETVSQEVGSSSTECEMDKDPCSACVVCSFMTYSTEHFEKHTALKHPGVTAKSVAKMISKQTSAEVRKDDAVFYHSVMVPGNSTKNSTTAESSPVPITDAQVNNLSPLKQHLAAKIFTDIMARSKKGNASSKQQSNLSIKVESLYCLTCPYNNVYIEKIKCHTFVQHPVGAAAATLNSSRECLDPQDITFFCVREDCSHSSTDISSFQIHLINCCSCTNTLIVIEKERLKATITFISELMHKQNLKATADFIDFASLHLRTCLSLHQSTKLSAATEGKILYSRSERASKNKASSDICMSIGSQPKKANYSITPNSQSPLASRLITSNISGTVIHLSLDANTRCTDQHDQNNVIAPKNKASSDICMSIGSQPKRSNYSITSNNLPPLASGLITSDISGTVINLSLDANTRCTGQHDQNNVIGKIQNEAGSCQLQSSNSANLNVHQKNCSVTGNTNFSQQNQNLSSKISYDPRRDHWNSTFQPDLQNYQDTHQIHKISYLQTVNGQQSLPSVQVTTNLLDTTTNRLSNVNTRCTSQHYQYNIGNSQAEISLDLRRKHWNPTSQPDLQNYQDVQEIPNSRWSQAEHIMPSSTEASHYNVKQSQQSQSLLFTSSGFQKPEDQQTNLPSVENMQVIPNFAPGSESSKLSYHPNPLSIQNQGIITKPSLMLEEVSATLHSTHQGTVNVQRDNSFIHSSRVAIPNGSHLYTTSSSGPQTALVSSSDNNSRNPQSQSSHVSNSLGMQSSPIASSPSLNNLVIQQYTSTVPNLPDTSCTLVPLEACLHQQNVSPRRVTNGSPFASAFTSGSQTPEYRTDAGMRPKEMHSAGTQTPQSTNVRQKLFAVHSRGTQTTMPTLPSPPATNVRQRLLAPVPHECGIGSRKASRGMPSNRMPQPMMPDGSGGNDDDVIVTAVTRITPRQEQQQQQSPGRQINQSAMGSVLQGRGRISIRGKGQDSFPRAPHPVPMPLHVPQKQLDISKHFEDLACVINSSAHEEEPSRVIDDGIEIVSVIPGKDKERPNQPKTVDASKFSFCCVRCGKDQDSKKVMK